MISSRGLEPFLAWNFSCQIPGLFSVSWNCTSPAICLSPSSPPPPTPHTPCAGPGQCCRPRLFSGCNHTGNIYIAYDERPWSLSPRPSACPGGIQAHNQSKTICMSRGHTSSQPVQDHLHVQGAWRPTVQDHLHVQGAWKPTVQDHLHVQGAWKPTVQDHLHV